MPWILYTDSDLCVITRAVLIKTQAYRAPFTYMNPSAGIDTIKGVQGSIFADMDNDASWTSYMSDKGYAEDFP